MNDWRLRRASPEDAAAVALVAGASFLATFAGILPGPDMIAHVAKNSSVTKFADWAASDDSVVTLAEHANGLAPVGYSLLTAPDFPVPTGPGDIELRRIYAMPAMLGTGLGAALMARAIEDARARDADRLMLGVLGVNERARAFYARQGFVVVGERQYRIGSMLCDDFVYALTL